MDVSARLDRGWRWPSLSGRTVRGRVVAERLRSSPSWPRPAPSLDAPARRVAPWPTSPAPTTCPCSATMSGAEIGTLYSNGVSAGRDCLDWPGWVRAGRPGGKALRPPAGAAGRGRTGAALRLHWLARWPAFSEPRLGLAKRPIDLPVFLLLEGGYQGVSPMGGASIRASLGPLRPAGRTHGNARREPCCWVGSAAASAVVDLEEPGPINVAASFGRPSACRPAEHANTSKIAWPPGFVGARGCRPNLA